MLSFAVSYAMVVMSVQQKQSRNQYLAGSVVS